MSNIENKLRLAEYKFASTMKHIPHHYTLAETWQTREEFENAVRYIRENGVQEKFGNKIYTYLYVGKYKYWTMGSPINETKLINRVGVKESSTKRHIRMER